MISVVSIVEGDGEVAALPVLLRRLGEWLTPGKTLNIGRPIRVRREQFLNRDDIFCKQLTVAASMCPDPGWILILLDADDDCPEDLAETIHERAAAVAPGRNISVVLANREYEAWFIAAAESLDGKRGFASPARVADAESVRGAKQWMSKQIRQGAYHEVVDQPAFSAHMDLQQAHDNSRSFRKLCGDWTNLMGMVAP